MVYHDVYICTDGFERARSSIWAADIEWDAAKCDDKILIHLAIGSGKKGWTTMCHVVILISTIRSYKIV